MLPPSSGRKSKPNKQDTAEASATACWLLAWLCFDPEDGDIRFLQNVSAHSVTPYRIAVVTVANVRTSNETNTSYLQTSATAINSYCSACEATFEKQ